MELLEEKLCILSGINRFGRRFGLRSDFEVFDLSHFCNAFLDNQALFAYAHLIQHLVRDPELIVQMLRKFASCIHMWQIFESAKVIRLLVLHIWEYTAPNTLVKARFINAPADCPQGLTDIFTVAYEQAVAAASCVTNNSAAYARTKASYTVMLRLYGVLIRIVVGGIKLETTGQGRTSHLLVG